jgi:hypothetical protein
MNEQILKDFNQARANLATTDNRLRSGSPIALNQAIPQNITIIDPSAKWGKDKWSKPQEARFKLSITFKLGMRATMPYWSYDFVKLTDKGQKYRLYNESIGYDKLCAMLEKMPTWKYSKASMFFAEDGFKKTDGTGDHKHWLWTAYPDGHRVGRRLGKPIKPIFENGMLQIATTLTEPTNSQGVLIKI